MVIAILKSLLFERDNKIPTQGKLNVNRNYLISTRKYTTIQVVGDLVRPRSDCCS